VIKTQKLFGTLILTVATLASITACQPAELAVDPLDLTPPPTETPEVEDVLSAVFPQDESSEQSTINLEGALVTDSGLQFVDMNPADGPKPQMGDIVTLNFIATLPDGTEFGNTYTQGGPVKVIIGRGQLLPGWEEGVLLMTEGSSARMAIPPELAFGTEGYGIIPPNSQILMVVELLTIEKPPSPVEVLESDLQETDSGLQYFDIKVGDGDEALEGLIVTNNFTLWVDGDNEATFIGSSDDTGPITFEVGKGDIVFTGWEEGVLNMKVGGKRYLVVPSDLALGEQGGGDIPPNATLILEIELTEVKAPTKPTVIDENDYITTESGLKYYDIVEGEGASPEKGMVVVTHYMGWLEDGTMFDSSIDRGEPFSFTLNDGVVIDGWVEGILGMKVGGKRQLVIPPDLAYGDTGSGGTIPPGATLIFEVELLNVQEE
jgi:peptidylprolyl isomerase